MTLLAGIIVLDRVHALHAAGKTQRDITAATGVGRPTVRLETMQNRGR